MTEITKNNTENKVEHSPRSGMSVSLVEMIKETIERNSDHPALSNLNEQPLTYKQLGEKIAYWHSVFKVNGIERGDKIALCAKNSANWAVIFLSTATYGAVSVPILNGFTPESIQELTSHSEAKLLFTEKNIWEKLDRTQLTNILEVWDVDTDELLYSPQTPNSIEKPEADYYTDTDSDLLIINYTSGSTGMSKGVMITYGNMKSNAVFAVENIPYLHPGDNMVSMLPLAHTFGMLVELVFPLLKGCHISFLGRTPSPGILLSAFAKLKPKLVVTVPLVIEKIVKNKVFPVTHKPLMKVLLKLPGISELLYGKIKKSMLNAFGGNLHQLIIGGAALNPDVEKFLRRIKFPYTVGYGMTECSPLIAYCHWNEQKEQSCGRIVDRMEARIESPNPAEIPGVLWVRGSNVMKGYYRNPEATEAVFDGEWMNTGDICLLDEDGYLFIKGRDKAMILGPSGQNIYPEEIENKLNNLPFVAESVVVDRDGRLVALVYPDYEAADKAGISKGKLSEMMDYNLSSLNKIVPSYAKVSQIELRDEPFEKTPKMSIKRFLYK